MNPFATEFVRPGAIEFQFESVNLDRLIAVWRDAGGIGQIVGPHGSGKTTLLHAIARDLTRTGELKSMIQLQRTGGMFCRQTTRQINVDSQGTRGAACHPGQLRNHALQNVMLIDGFEQLNPLARLAVLRRVRGNRGAIMVTAHRRLWNIPVLLQTVPSLDRFRCLVDGLLESIEPAQRHILKTDMRAAFKQSNGNMREALFALYDVFHVRQTKFEQHVKGNRVRSAS